MQIPDRAPLFAWAYLDDHSDLETIHQLLAAIPDDALLDALRKHRGHGRNDYPVEACWGTALLTSILRHPTTEACLNELRRNAALRLLLGLEHADDVPTAYAMSRFYKTLGLPAHLALAHAAFASMVTVLGEHVPSLGVAAAGDSTALKARVDRSQEPLPDLPAPSGGRKEYRDDAGKVTKTVTWFGYKLHLLVDVRHEVALAYQVTGAHDDDAQTLPAVLDQARDALPPERIRTLAYDKAADNGDFHAAVQDRGITPLVETRHLWKDQPYRALPGAEGRPVPIVYDELGTVYCQRTFAGLPDYRPMAFCGREDARGTLKYRCPALAHDLDCPCEKLCNAGKTYGLTVRVRQDLNLRRFPPVPRATKTFERLYAGRTAVERVNGRLKCFWGIDDGNIGGAARFHAQVGTVMLVHAAFATVLVQTPRRDGVLGITRLGPVQRALRQAARPAPAAPARRR